jgi:hypothetical protein
MGIFYFLLFLYFVAVDAYEAIVKQETIMANCFAFWLHLAFGVSWLMLGRDFVLATATCVFFALAAFMVRKVKWAPTLATVLAAPAAYVVATNLLN